MTNITRFSPLDKNLLGGTIPFGLLGRTKEDEEEEEVYSPPAFGAAASPLDEICYEVFLSDIAVAVSAGETEQDEDSWSVSDPSPLELLIDAIKTEVGKYMLHVTKGDHITKFCVCLPKGVPFVRTGKGEFWKLLKGLGFPKNTCRWKPKTRYRCANLDKVCEDEAGLCGPQGTSGQTTNCSCNDYKAINLKHIDSDTKEYTDSKGKIHKLNDPGEYKKVIEQIVSIEKGIKLTCVASDVE